MAFNVPTVTENRLSFGPGVLYLGPEGVTPTVDIGAVDAAMSISLKRTYLDLYQGSPKTLVARKCVQEDVDIEITAREWNLQTLQRALGGGVYSVAGSEELLELGGDLDFTDCCLRLVHKTPAGGTVTVDAYKVNGGGEINVGFGEEWTAFPLKFSALEAATNWAGTTLIDGKKKVKMSNVLPP